MKGTILLITIVAALCLNSLMAQGSAFSHLIAFYNVENLFDNKADSIHHDYEFTPRGPRHWTQQRLDQKVHQFWHTVAAMGQTNADSLLAVEPSFPTLIGLAEVENSYVLRHLCQSSPLGRHYRWLHYESPDPRGVDCALLYHDQGFQPLASCAIPVSDTSRDIHTRDILAVTGLLMPTADTLCLYVCHLPSQLGGARADSLRHRIVLRLKYMLDSTARRHPSAFVAAMGDFNCGPRSHAMLPFVGDSLCRNLMLSLPRGEGSHKYRGHWEYLDQIVVRLTQAPWIVAHAGVFSHPQLLTADRRYQGLKPFRTYNGTNYQGGPSDHLPVVLCIQHR